MQVAHIREKGTVSGISRITCTEIGGQIMLAVVLHELDDLLGAVFAIGAQLGVLDAPTKGDAVDLAQGNAEAQQAAEAVAVEGRGHIQESIGGAIEYARRTTDAVDGEIGFGHREAVDLGIAAGAQVQTHGITGAKHVGMGDAGGQHQTLGARIPSTHLE